jgi:hypothetical protein
MVRSATTRTNKFNAKWDGSVVNARITEYKPFMVEQINVAYPQQAMIEQKVKDYLEPLGMYTIQQHHYMNFAGELWAKSRMFTGVTLRMEAELVASKWLRRGCNPTYLIEIARRMGITLTAFP